MSNPAIVLMTDPSRCSLGDVHHLVQALLEMQQMGQHAIPQAFCDHPEAAGDFVDAYAHAYPQLVLEDREIPTPDHLHSLISSGQIGALGRPPELAPADELHPPVEPNGTSTLPIVMLTLGSSQVLLDALQQAPAIRESIRLIDVGQERADTLSVTIADAVALDGQGREHESRDGARPELDEIAGVSTTDAASLTLHEDRLNLDMVETEDAPREEPAAADGVAKKEAPVAPASTPTLAPLAVSELNADGARSDDGFGDGRTVEPVTQTPALVESARSIEADPAELAAPLADQDLTIDEQAFKDGDQNDKEVVGEQASPGEEAAAADEVTQEQALVAPASIPTLAPVAVSELNADAARSDDGFGDGRTVEPEAQALVESARSIEPDPAELAAPLADQDLTVDEQAFKGGDQNDKEVVGEQAPPGEEAAAADEVTQEQAPVAPATTPTLAPAIARASMGDPAASIEIEPVGLLGQDETPADPEIEAAGGAGKATADQNDDVHYPPVGNLIAGADVLYPALDGGTHGALRELASVLLDDGIFDAEGASDFIEAQRGESLPVPARQEATLTVRPGDKAVTFEDAYGADDQQSDDHSADTTATRPLHDSDL